MALFDIGQEVTLKKDHIVTRLAPLGHEYRKGVITSIQPEAASGIRIGAGIHGFTAWSADDLEWTTAEALRQVMKVVVALPEPAGVTMPDLNRPHIEHLMARPSECWPYLNETDAVRMALEWLNALPADVVAELPAVLRDTAVVVWHLSESWRLPSEEENEQNTESGWLYNQPV